MSRPPNQRMRELFSGIPAPKRNRRILMPMQAFIDDSVDGSVLTLAGYIAPYEKWEKFSVDWQELLSMSPPWERFKMAEIAGSKDPLRLERAGWFYRVVERYADAFVAVAVEIEPLKAVVREMGLPRRRFADPYIFAHRVIMDATLQYQRDLGISEPVDFIFDKFQRREKFIREGWEFWISTLSPEMRALIGREPRFETDDEFLPLQAADMLAWHAREHWLRHRSLTAGEALLLSWKPKNNPKGYRFNFGYAELRENFQQMRSRAVEVGMIPSIEVKVTFSLNGKPKIGRAHV